MSKEDKILGLLENLSIQVNNISTDVSVLKIRMDKFQKGQDDLQKGQDELQKGQDELQKGQDELQKGQDELQKGQDELTVKFNALSNRVDDVHSEVQGIKLHLENVTDRNIQILMEQYIPNSEKLDNTAEEVKIIKFDVDNLKLAVMSHSRDINELMKR